MNKPPDMAATPDLVAAMRRALDGAGGEALPGGVSSDIRLFEHDGRRYCLKRALARLKVAADWRAPVERNHSEAEWLRVAAAIVPDAVPRVIHEDRDAGWFAMEYLPPDEFPVWKNALRDGAIDPSFAGAVGKRLVRIHAATAGSAEVAATFANDPIFYPLRPEPYLVATAGRHPDLVAALQGLADRTMRTHLALVHGDVSPKNILSGPRGPVLLDAECAWYGDPAFDLAFVLNHMFLKCVWRPQWAQRYLQCYDALAAAYLGEVDWEDRREIDRRTAALLPGLLLGRVDGKSPAEYITSAADREQVRAFARQHVAHPPDGLGALRRAWSAHCEPSMRAAAATVGEPARGV